MTNSTKGQLLSQINATTPVYKVLFDKASGEWLLDLPDLFDPNGLSIPLVGRHEIQGAVRIKDELKTLTIFDSLDCGFVRRADVGEI